MSCENPADWVVDQTGRGLVRLCRECVLFRHCGESFSLLAPVKRAAACECQHMPAKMEQDRAAVAEGKAF